MKISRWSCILKNQTYAERLKVLAAQEELNDIVELRETGTLVQAGLLAPMPEEVYSLVENPQTFDGICYGVPRYSTTLGMIYNVDIFERLGLSVPSTYEEFLQVCGTLKASGYDAVALGAADIWHMKFWGNYLFCNYIVTEEGQVCWTKERVMEMLGDFRGLASRGYIHSRYRAVSDSETAQAISARQAVMVYTGPWMLSQIENLNPQIRLGFFFLPGRDGTAYAMDDSNVEWGISSVTAGDEKKMDAAVRFLQFYYSEGIYETILEIMNGDSVTVRQVYMPDTPNQRIMKAAYEREPVHTELLVEDASSPDGFITYYDQMLIETLWGGKSISSLAENLLERWEEP
jgi:raffinose/stachyose/melibiose transport system substrate-binding protein